MAVVLLLSPLPYMNGSSRSDKMLLVDWERQPRADWCRCCAVDRSQLRTVAGNEGDGLK